jgi:hypothetical protein
MSPRSGKNPMTMAQIEVPHGRNGKHKLIVTNSFRPRSG